jgi:hypothetical protein
MLNLLHRPLNTLWCCRKLSNPHPDRVMDGANQRRSYPIDGNFGHRFGTVGTTGFIGLDKDHIQERHLIRFQYMVRTKASISHLALLVKEHIFVQGKPQC